MADIASMAGISAGSFSGIFSGLYSLVLWVLLLGVIGVIGWKIYDNKKYIYQVKLKLFTNKKFAYFQSTAKRVVDNGADYWYIKGLKERVPVPPGYCMYQGVKGGWVAEGFYDRQLGVIWSRDEMSVEKFEQYLEALKEKQEGKNTGQSINTNFQPMTSADRSLQAAQVTKAVLRRGKDFWSMFWQALPLVIIFMFIVVVIIFWGKILQPVLDVTSSNAVISKDNALIQQQNLRFYQLLIGQSNATLVVQQFPGDTLTFNGSGIIS